MTAHASSGLQSRRVRALLFVKGIYAAEQRSRVLDVRVESYMLRQSRLAAPQSSPAPNFVELRAVQEFVNQD